MENKIWAYAVYNTVDFIQPVYRNPVLLFVGTI